MLKLLQEIRGFSEIANRRPPPRSPTLVLAQIKAYATQGRLRRRKLSISINPQAQSEIPDQVRIVHVKPAPQPAASLPAS
jgi:hypothetical protein